MRPGPASRRFALFICGLAVAAPIGAGAQRADQSRGLWIGAIPVCVGTVASVRVEIDDILEQPQAVVTFRPAWRAALLRETTRLYNRPMPVRIDGRTLMAPTVREPITGGVIAVSPVTARQIERIQAAVARPCPRGRP